MHNLILIFRWIVTLGITIIIGFLIGSGVMTFFLSFQEKPQENKIEKKVLESTTQLTPTSVKRKISSNLKEVVLDELIETKGSYGIVIENLKTGELYMQNENKEYETASLYKLWVMGAVYKAIEEHKINKDDVLRQDIATLNQKFKIATESAEKTDGTISQSVESALKQMITISDNYSALLLTEKIRLSKVASYLERNKFTNSKVGTGGNNPKSTPLDIALFYKKLLNGELGDSKTTESMLNLLKLQQINNKIPKYLPSSTVIAHKTGELGGFSHDTGIIYTQKSNYIFVILSESSSRTQADLRIANISKAVYNYFSSE